MEEKVHVPPIKIQGIKTKLVPFIRDNVQISESTLWIEPFIGSGVVGFNLAPQNAIFADTNPHLINFYNAIKNGGINAQIVREFLQIEGAKLADGDSNYYYEVRDRFNKEHNVLDFLFLNRCCFNGLIRFNRKGNFNTPYGHKHERFSKAYITKVCNQVAFVEQKIRKNNWIFLCQSFEQTIRRVDTVGAFFEDVLIYCDAPYIGRHVDYYNGWTEKDEVKLHNTLMSSVKKRNVRFVVSTWLQNSWRKNEFVDEVWNGCKIATKEHFYHVGAKEANRGNVIEALLVNER
jgi:modification methylase ecoRV